MTDRHTKTCELEFERGLLRCVEGLFKNVQPPPGRLLAPTPVIGGRFFPSMDHSHLLPQVCAALCAREHFRQTAPPWAPILPLRYEDCEELATDDSPQLNVVGLFGHSMRSADWEYQSHPSFATFASGLMAYRSTPDHIRADYRLRQEFPPHRLKGLCDGHLCWRSPARIAVDRDIEARCAAMDAREAAERLSL